YGPNDSSCSGPPVFTDTRSVSGNGSYDSTAFAPALSGTYRWTASYSGDASNSPAASACNAPNESLVVSPASPTLSGTASSGVPFGGQIHDTVILAGGAAPTGAITFRLYGPGDAS